VKRWWIGVQSRDWISLIAAIAVGPVFLKIGYKTGLVFDAAAFAYFLCCMFVVPILTLCAGRLKFLTWQIAILSLAFTVVEDNLRLNAIYPSEIAGIAFLFWALGTLLSSPVPIYFLLRPLAPRQRYAFGVVLAVAALALWFGIKRITG
jgi:hypothetical protein